MSFRVATPSLADLSRLGRQIEKDRSFSPNELRQRDHAIGLQCDATEDMGRLLFWLKSVPGSATNEDDARTEWFSEVSAANLLRLLAAVLGFMTMSGFLLSGEKVINVFVFLLLFVVMQVIFSLVSSYVMIMSWLGNTPVIFPLNIAKYLIYKAIPDKRFLRESQSVVRVLLLRYGHEFGAIFTLGAVGALFVLLLNGFYFYWDPTYNFTVDSVRCFTTHLASPWSSWLPDAVVSKSVIENSRFDKLPTDITREKIAIIRGWWPFLSMAMLCYALMPRIILWALSKLFYVKLMRRSFVQYPGSESILLRMKSPLVSTRALDAEESDYVHDSVVQLDDRLMLIAWAGALDTADLNQFEDIRIVPHGNVLVAGLGTLADDLICINKINEKKPSRLLVVVKSWEPPMTELRNFLNRIKQTTRCTLYLMPLPGRTVADLHLQEWSKFSRELRFDVVDTQPLISL